jgi:carbamoyl-phosphate synthase large subunit
MARGLNVIGLMNVQFAIQGEGKDAVVYVLEVNPRASRTVPFVSKASGMPLAKIAARCMAGRSLDDQGIVGEIVPPYFSVKEAVFPFVKFPGVDTILGPEMKSTGEVMGVDYTFKAALAKALMAAGLMLPPRGNILFSVADRDKAEALPIIKKFASVGYTIYATEGTAAMIEAVGLPVKMISKKLHEGHPNIIDIIRDGTLNGVVNTVTGDRVPLRDGFDIRRAAAEKRTPCFTSLDTARVAADALLEENIYNVQPLPDYRNKSA